MFVVFVDSSLDFKMEQVKFFVNHRSKRARESEHVVRSVEVASRFDSPLAVYRIELNANARVYFDLVDFNATLTLPAYDNSTDSTSNGKPSQTQEQAKATFKLKFHMRKYLEETRHRPPSLNMSLDDLDAQLLHMPKCTLHTNLAGKLDVPLFIYDGRLAIVRI